MSKTFELYGRDWPEGVPLATIELMGMSQHGKTPGFLSRFEHAVKAYELLWPMYPIRVTFPNIPYYAERGLNGVTVENTFFLSVLKALCEHKEVVLTGCASSGKSFAASVYMLMCFYSDPMRTMGILSTTSVKALDARIWAEIKMLHNCCIQPVGSIVNYLTALIFDPSKTFTDEKDAAIRDMRNGILGVAIPNDSQGQGALTTIAGRKNKNIIWSIDEAPFMPDNVLAPCTNLEANEFFQVVLIGNAGKQTDPHGSSGEPKDGWPEGEFTSNTWETKRGGICVHLDGTKSPNLFPGHEKIDDVSRLPFPSLINHFFLERMAIREGQGNVEEGRKSAGYWMMARGIWLPSSMDATVLTASIVRSSGADKEIRWGYGGKTTLAAADPSFTTTGDEFVIQLGDIGDEEDSGETVMQMHSHHIRITPEMGSGDELYDQLAAKVVRVLLANNVEPGNFGMDVSHDGGIMAQAIMKIWGTNAIHLISSLGTPTDRLVSDQDNAPAKDRYDRQVTEYWFSLRVAVQLGRIKGFNLQSEYAKDLFSRKYTFKPGGKVAVETKSEMKARVGHSPGAGDAATYLCEVARRSGLLPMERIGTATPRVSRTLSFDPITLKPKAAASHPAFQEKNYDKGWSSFQIKPRKKWGY